MRIAFAVRWGLAVMQPMNVTPSYPAAVQDTARASITTTSRVMPGPDTTAGVPAPVLHAVTGAPIPCVNGKADVYDCRNVELVAFLPAEAIGLDTVLDFDEDRKVLVNDMWGWTDPKTKRDYALVGLADATAFVDVTDPAHPHYRGKLPMPAGAQASLWRDIKVYQHYAFVVSDAAKAHGMQVFDLAELRHVNRTPVVFREAAHYGGIGSAHNLAIDTATGFAYAMGSNESGETCGGGLHMIDIRQPLQPVFAGCYADPKLGIIPGNVHDAECVVYHGPDARYRGREVCANAAGKMLGIADVTDKQHPTTVSIVSYPNVAFAHQGWFDETQRYFFLGDEFDEVHGAHTRTLVFDLADLTDPVLVKEYFASTTNTDHNLYVRGHYVYEANYGAGFRVLDVHDPVNPTEAGFFDTTPEGRKSLGAWTAYPFFGNGVVGVSSIGEGLYLLRVKSLQP